MRVKFFSAEPQKLRDEYTRYLYVLQLRKQLEHGILQCTDDRMAAELAAFLLQGEFGAYDSRQHTPAFVSTIPFYPPERQTETLELAILHEYQKLRSMILKLDMHGKKLKLVVAEENEQARKVMEHTFVFVLPDTRSCKHLWKCAVEHHAFFRLRGIPKPPTKLQQFFRLKSRFYASFRTEHQLAQENSYGSSSFRRRNTSTGQSLRSEASEKSLSRPNSGTEVRRGKSSFKRVSTRRVAARPSFVGRPSGPRLSQPPAPVPSPTEGFKGYRHGSEAVPPGGNTKAKPQMSEKRKRG
ncbi:Band 4.1-like protein [Echinococcus granulosus]|uniref:Band 4.1-like protein n=1 Tax=Echinococcus granulosus TaxID=6210 RepID=W6UIB0_ECHGR|nr:Band 4.1-like protein [Echinococcus granulosus]EUB60836.1 Band 4.1-like protein [Echinococcus granulosus]